MADLKIAITDFAPEFAKLSGRQDFKTAFPNTLAALNIVAHKILVGWRKATSGEQFEGMPYPVWSRGDYTRSIQANLDDDQLKEIYSQGPWTGYIEKGHGEIDLKEGLLSGPKARLGKNGPYNIVSFRIGTPGTLPSNQPMDTDTYQFIQRETNKAQRAYNQTHTGRPGITTVTGQGPGTIQRASGKVDLKKNYNWGVSVPPSKGGTPRTKDTSKGQYTWTTGRFTGMYRFKAGAGATNQYRTFRVVSVHSDPASWIVPPLEGNPIRRAVVDSVERDAKQILKLAMEEDLK